MSTEDSDRRRRPTPYERYEREEWLATWRLAIEMLKDAVAGDEGGTDGGLPAGPPVSSA